MSPQEYTALIEEIKASGVVEKINKLFFLNDKTDIAEILINQFFEVHINVFTIKNSSLPPSAMMVFKEPQTGLNIPLFLQDVQLQAFIEHLQFKLNRINELKAKQKLTVVNESDELLIERKTK